MLFQALSLPTHPHSPLISTLSSAAHFCHQFSDNCHRHSLHVRGPLYTTHTSYQHVESFSLTITGEGITLEIETEGKRE